MTMKKIVISLLTIATCTFAISCSPKPSPQEKASSTPTDISSSNSSSGSPSSTTSGSGITQNSTTISQFVKTPVTLAKFNSLAMGMTYEQVVAALGEPSSKSVTEIKGLPTSTAYVWVNLNYAGLTTLVFQENKLTLKSQNNLQQDSASPQPQNALTQDLKNQLEQQKAKAKQSEARNNIGAFNRALQASYLDKNEFTSIKADLSLGIPDETENYKYTIDVIDKKQMVRVIATSKQEGLKSYLGIVFLVKIGNQIATQAIACESIQPTKATPPKPSNASRDSGTQTCPDGYRNLGG